jgi:hypothetical protein
MQHPSGFPLVIAKVYQNWIAHALKIDAFPRGRIHRMAVIFIGCAVRGLKRV